MKRFVIVGLGTFGSSVAEALYEKGHEVVAVDISEDRVDNIVTRVTRAAVGDARDSSTLERLGAEDADVGIVSTGDDMSASILAVMGLKDLGVEEIYTKVISREHARIMKKLGVTETVLPEQESAVNLATRVARGSNLRNYVHLGDGFSMQEMVVPPEWAGKTLRELNLRQRYRVQVIAIHDEHTDAMDSVPDPDEPLNAAETILLAGRDENLERVAKLAE